MCGQYKPVTGHTPSVGLCLLELVAINLPALTVWLVMMVEHILDTNSDPNLVIVQWVSLPVCSHIAISP